MPRWHSLVNTNFHMKIARAAFLVVLAVCVCVNAVTADPAPKKLLVVSVTTGFRHSSIADAEKALMQMADQTHAFTLDFARQPAGKPAAPKKPTAPKANASGDAQTAFEGAMVKYNADLAAAQPALAKWDADVKQALLKLAPESLKNYDGVIFASTTGDLPIPDKEGFLAWIKAGHAFIGIHAATDTFHGWPAYIDMIGGEFQTHHAQVAAECFNKDPQHPATRSLGAKWEIQQEELYRFKNYDVTRVHELLALEKDPNDGSPGHFPMAWCKEYGAGKVFYTALGHREDLWDNDPALKDRKNSVETAKAFQAHVLGGISWALGLETGDAKPQAQQVK